MFVREIIEKREAQTLALYATLAQSSRGRKYPEQEHDFRTAFQRDRDRILHSTAFRRLAYKTQVFVNYEGDHYRSRLTHTLEVAQISRTIARVLALNEDLTEAIALAHDLGHGPFGHATERALARLMKNRGGFEHNAQSLRVVEILEERYPGFPGLNLSWEVLNGIKKHERSDRRHFMCLEAQVVDAADEIAYNSHDLDDGLRAGFFNEAMLCENVPLWKQIYREIDRKNKQMSIYHKRLLAIRRSINGQVEEVIAAAKRNVRRFHIQTYEDVAKTPHRVVELDRSMRAKVERVRQFLNQHLYNHYRVARMTDKAQRFVEKIFKVYERSPSQLPPHFQQRVAIDGLHRTICDYIAGMTDRYALDEYKKLYEPYERV